MKLIDNLFSFVWIYDKIFWKLLDKLVYQEEEEDYKNILKALWYEDIDNYFSKKIDRKQFKELSTIIFRFTNKDNEDRK